MTPYEQAKSFLSLVLPPSGLYAVMYRGPKGMRHQFCETIDATAHACLQRSDAGVEVWYGPASYKDRARTQANATALKALWVDLDVKKDKGYADTDTALDHLYEFCDQQFFEPTVVVCSGYGVHAYWVFTEAITKDEWQPVADRFQAHWQAFGLVSDPVSADAARVLRCPGTHNYKHSDSKAVFVIDQSGELHDFDAVAERMPATSPKAAPAHLAALGNDDLFGGMRGRDLYTSAIIQRCRQLGAIANTQGADCQEPLWYATVQLVRHTLDGADAAHDLSCGHPGYSADAVDAKLDQLAAKDIGPTTCERFRLLNPQGCTGCTYKVTSPIQLGEKEPEAIVPVVVAQVPVATAGGVTVQAERSEPPVPVPHPFSFTNEGLVVKTKDPESGVPKTELLYSGYFWPKRIYRASPTDSDLTVEFFYQPMRQGAKCGTFIAPNEALYEPKELRKVLARKMTMNNDAFKHFPRYVNMMTTEMQRRMREDVSATQMGWQPKGAYDAPAFVHNNALYLGSPCQIHKDFTSSTGGSRSIFRHCAPEGTREGAAAGARLYLRPGGEMHQFIYLYGLLGLFAPFSGQQNFALLSVVNRVGGEGKTTNCDAAMSHWFEPVMSRSTPIDTDNAIFNTLSTRGTLPFFLDEATNMDPKRMVNFIYTASQGREKARMEMSGARQRETMPPWKSPVLMTSNMSALQLARGARGDATALDARVLELRYERLDLSAADRSAVSAVFYENHGITGPMAVQHVMNNMQKFSEHYKLFHGKFQAALGHNSPDRFWLNSVCAVMCAAVALKEMGIADYDLPQLGSYCVRLIKAQRAESAADVATASDILARFLAANIGRIMVGYRTPGTTSDSCTRLTTLADQVRSELVGRSQLDEQALYISRAALRDFCTEYGHDFRSFIAEASECGLLAKQVRTGSSEDGRAIYGDVPERYVLGRGTAYATAPVRVLSFDLRHSSLRHHINDVRSAVAQSQSLRPMYANDSQ